VTFSVRRSLHYREDEKLVYTYTVDAGIFESKLGFHSVSFSQKAIKIGELKIRAVLNNLNLGITTLLAILGAC